MSDVDSLIENAWRERREGNGDKSLAILQRALADCSEATVDRAKVLIKLGQLKRDTHEYFESTLYYLEAEHLLQDGQDPFFYARVLRSLAYNFCEQRRYYLAKIKIELAILQINLFPEPDELEVANIYRIRALISEESNQKELAIKHWQEAKLAYKKIGTACAVEECESHLSSLNSAK